jgi:hypothetical protein
MAKKIYKVISWILLILTIISLWLVVRKPSLPEIEISPEADRSFDQKLNLLAASQQQGSPTEIHITEAELNSKLNDMFLDTGSTGGLSTLRAVTARFEGEKVFATLTIEVIGLDVYVTLGGKLGVHDQILQFKTTDVRMGKMPVPAVAVESVLSERMNSPEMREVLRLPDYIKDVRVENSELVLKSQ